MRNGRYPQARDSRIGVFVNSKSSIQNIFGFPMTRQIEKDKTWETMNINEVVMLGTQKGMWWGC